ncbi:hypothetical protein ACIO3O_37530 [Streptomyces sp. NPDC087440]|uniref:hypothetical protein n=1 Tax=Streptomyces sp. NPDC087440 TaxID=3365790 RepID=UPI0038242F47
MTSKHRYEQPIPGECYEECLEAQPAGPNGEPRCICERINEFNEFYEAEPDDMAALESRG